MTTFETMVAAAMSGDATALDRATLLSLIQRLIFCPGKGCGRVMDIRRSCLVNLSRGRQVALCGACWDRMVADLAGQGFGQEDIARALVVDTRRKGAKS